MSLVDDAAEDMDRYYQQKLEKLEETKDSVGYYTQFQKSVADGCYIDNTGAVREIKTVTGPTNPEVPHRPMFAPECPKLVKAGFKVDWGRAIEQHKPGYHLNPPPKGKFGELSKVKEELAELEDALAQDCVIMAAVELSDLYGALREYAKEKFHLTMIDLERMADITKRAFEVGDRE